MSNTFTGFVDRQLDWDHLTPRTDDLPLATKDNIFYFQLHSTDDFSYISTQTLKHAGIAQNDTTALKIIQASHKMGIIDPTNGQPATANITRHMASNMPFLSLRKQRNLVLLLFFMQEEIIRQRMVSDTQKAVLPSQRDTGSSPLGSAQVSVVAV